MGKYRMYEPYGYEENNEYLGKITQLDNELATNRENDNKEFASVEYSETLKAFIFKNVKGEGVGTAYMSDIIPQDLIKDAKYDVETKSIVITFVNDQTITIPLDDIIDVAEAGDGLQLIDNKFSILIPSESEDFLSVNSDGIKVTGVQDAINVERDRAISAETEENERAVAVEGELSAAIQAEVTNRISDVDTEETRAKGAEDALDAKINQEIVDRTTDVDSEETRAKKEEKRIDDTIGGGFSTASTETITYKLNATNQTLATETNNRITQDNQLQNSINNEVTARQGEITRLENIIVDKTEPLEDKIESLEDKVQALSAATSGKADTSAVTEAIDAIDAAYKAADAAISGAVDSVSSDVATESQRAVSAEQALSDSIGTKLASSDFESYSASVDTVIASKADKETTYTQEEVDGLIAEKENEITQIKKDYNTLKEIVAELGGNVEWGVPSDGTFNNMIKKSGTVKLEEDITTSTYTGEITSKNETTLNLNGKNLTFSGQTTTNPGIMTKGKQKLTIMGKGTIDAAGHIAVEANGDDTVINLSGKTGFFGSEPTYVTDRSGGELIYCYLGTINISAGVFKNIGENKKYLLNCYDANYRNGTAKIVVTGGKFYDFNPSDNSAEGEHTNYVPDGYYVETSTDGESTVYTVKKNS